MLADLDAQLASLRATRRAAQPVDTQRKAVLAALSDIRGKAEKNETKAAALEAERMADEDDVRRQHAERGVVRSTDRRSEEKYRDIIEELQDNIKSSNAIINQFTMNLQQKDKEIEELKGTNQVRLPSLIFFFYSLFTHINVCFSLSFLSYLG